MESVQSANVDISKFLSVEKFKETQLQLTKCKHGEFVLLKMLEEEGVHADITLATEDGSVKAHRSVLACVSPVFNAMFNHNMKENLTSTVDIPDMSIDALQLFLLLLYTQNELDIERCAQEMRQFQSVIWKHFIELCEALNKYQVETSKLVQNVLEAALIKNFTPENCWLYFDCSLPGEPGPEFDFPYAIDQFDVSQWVLHCYILGNYKEVIKSQSFLEEMKRSPERIHNVVRGAEVEGYREKAVESLRCIKKNPVFNLDVDYILVQFRVPKLCSKLGFMAKAFESASVLYFRQYNKDGLKL